MKFMSTHETPSQLDASAPGNPSIQPAANSPATPTAQARINGLLTNHRMIAEELCTEMHNVFWILDLEDEKAEALARMYLSTEELTMLRKEVEPSSAIPAAIVVSNLATLNAYRAFTNRPTLAPPPSGKHYIVVCSSDLFVVAQSNIRNSAH